LKKKHNLILIFVISLILTIGLFVQSEASSTGSIRVSVPDQTKVLLYQVADYDGKNYSAAENLKDSGISMDALLENPSEAVAKDVCKYLEENHGADYERKSVYGEAGFENLEQGIWLVCTEQNHKTRFKPFFVFIPTETDGVKQYEINAEPKVDAGNKNHIHVSVTKKWDDHDNVNQKRPDSVTIKLLRNKKTVDNVKLSEKNGWTHTFKHLKKAEDYAVEEVEVDGYTAEYGGDVENGFVITNVYNLHRLPYTGQNWIPIIILFIAGISCVALGVLEARERRNEKKA